MWNTETIKQLGMWYTSPEGVFALAQEKRLFQRLVSLWPRRGRSFLDIGCGTGTFLEMLWEYGFDVTGFDINTETLDLAAERLGHRADFFQGQLDHTPFDDGSFDYTALFSILEYAEDPEAVLAEAIRVSRRGVLLGFTNRVSLFAVSQYLHRKRTHCLDMWSLRKMIRRVAPQGRLISRSVLLGPSSTWKPSMGWGALNRVLLPIPCGAYVGVCLDVQPPVPLTPLFLKAREKALAVCSGLRTEPEGSVSGRAFPGQGGIQPQGGHGE